MTDARKQCSAVRVGKNFCRNGFPQTAPCFGIDGGLPWCLNEKLCGRIFSETGRPPDHLLLESAP